MGHGQRDVPVVIATLLRPAGGTGVQTHFRELARHLADRGLPVVLVTPFSAGGIVRDAAFAVRRVIEPLSSTLSVLWYVGFHRRFLERALRRRLHRMEDAVVYCQCPASALAAARARGGGAHRVVLVVHFWVSQAEEWVSKGAIRRDGWAYRAIRQTEREVLQLVDGLVFVSETARAQLWLDPPGDVPAVTVPNFLVPEATEAPSVSGAADLVTVGSLEPHKNHAFLLDVLAAAARRGHRFTLDVVGEGPERHTLSARARRLGLDGQVRFLGYVPEARQFLACHRAYVHAASRETFGFAVLEAMACGLPVVAAPSGALAYLFDDGVEGRTWNPSDPEGAADVLIEVLADEQVRAEMGARARQRFLGQYDAAVVGPSLYDFLMRVPRRTGLPATEAPAAPPSTPAAPAAPPSTPAAPAAPAAPPSSVPTSTGTPWSPSPVGGRT